MKKIEAIVKTFKLEDVVERLRSVGGNGITVTEVLGFSPSTGSRNIFHGSGYKADSAPRYHLLIIVDDDNVDAIVRAISVAGTTDSPGDGLIVVCDVGEVFRVRTGETGAAAL